MADVPELDFLTDDEMERLIMALANGRQLDGKRSFTEDEASAVVSWARGVRIEQGTLACVLSGKIVVDVREDGELLFTAVPSPAGIGGRR